MIVADTSFVYALLDRRDERHAEAVSWYRTNDEELATTPLAIAEIDHLANARAGPAAAQAFRHDLKAGAYFVEWWAAALPEIIAVADRYADTGLSLTDASLVVLAARLQTATIATFDERHFRAVRPVNEAVAFELAPLDSTAP